MSISFRLLSTFTVLGSLFWACAPDLDALTSKYNPATGGAGGTTTGGAGGTTAGTSGGTQPTGGAGGTSSGGTGGDGTGGTIEAGAAGQAGSPDTTGGTGGTGGSTGGTHSSGGSGNTTSSCNNGTADSNESDVDCGGSSKCPRCDLKQRCGSNSDCLSGLDCIKGHCQAPSCSDNLQNGDETGIDCGGACVDQSFTCDDGTGCGANSDCTSSFCSDQVCTDHCLSKKKESDETDVDCGGKQCTPCADTKHCKVGDDCQSRICSGGSCVAPSCDDNVLNQNEGDKDCGGVCTPLKYCAVDQTCNAAADCASYVCTAGHCAADLNIPTGDMIDNFEDGNFNLPTTNGRVGNWYFYNAPDPSGQAMSTWAMEPIDGQRGPSSLVGQHTTGSNFPSWGCGIGVDLDNPGGGQSSKVPYNASFDNGGTLTPYAGVTFWARAKTALSVGVVFPDGDTDQAGGKCNQTDPVVCGPNGCVCDHHYLTAVSLTTEWKRYTILFKDLQLEAGTVPTPGPFDPTRLVSIQFRLNGGTTFDYWVDDVAFVRP
jgi:hypothetical protein